ncbi:MAG: aminotransferase class IV [Polyangiales bacterium]
MVAGEIVPLKAAALPLSDSAIFYGDALFETVRVEGGVAVALGPHIERLYDACRSIALPPAYSMQALEQAALALLRHAAWSTGVLRILLSRTAPLGPSPIAPLPAEGAGHAVLTLTPLPAPDPRLWRTGLRLACVALPVTPALGQLKSSSYLPQFWARRQAEAAGADDALVLDADGQVREGASSNLFVWRQGRVWTPPLSCGALPGVTRAVVLKLAAAEGFSVRAQVLYPHDLYSAEEVWLTSSIRELAPACCIDGVRIGTGVPGPVARALQRRYRAWIATTPAPASHSHAR